MREALFRPIRDRAARASRPNRPKGVDIELKNIASIGTKATSAVLVFM